MPIDRPVQPPASAAGDPPPRAGELEGFRIGVTSHRRSVDLITALERRGAEVLHAPALTIAPHDQDAQLVSETREVIRLRPEVVLVTTGYGVRRWFEVADTVGLAGELTEVLQRARIFARGAKAVGALRAAGLEDAQTSGLDTTAALVDLVVDGGWTGARVALQLHGHTDERQLERLRASSASVLTVTPYRWVQPSAADRLPRLVEAVTRAQLDAVVFTSAPGAVATLEAAEALGAGPALVHALRTQVLAAAVGPVTAAPLRAAGLEPVIPDRFRLGALIRLVSEELSVHRVERYRAGGAVLELRGRTLDVDGRTLVLGPGALALFRRLARSPGVVSRAELLEALPDMPDDHALEVAISRLRRTLGVPGLIETVVRRGYRLTASRCPAE